MEPGRVYATRVGLRFPGKVPFEVWEQAGEHLVRIADSSTWCLGDWLVYGQDEYADRYQRAVAMLGLDYQTLRNYAWVARRFSSARRRSALSFQHHAEVAALPVADQDLWLDRAEQHGWSRNQLRRHVRANRATGEAKVPAQTVLPKLPVSAERVNRWREAADQSSSPFEAWVIAALDRAANATLRRGQVG